MVFESLVAARNLEAQGVSASVTNMHTLKPFDTDAIEEACSYAALLVTVEEHGVIGGLGGAVAECAARRGGALGSCLLDCLIDLARAVTTSTFCGIWSYR